MFNGEDWHVGTSVRFWTGLREGEGRIGNISYEGVYMIGGTPSVYIRRDDGRNVGSVALSHVEKLAVQTNSEVA